VVAGEKYPTDIAVRGGSLYWIDRDIREKKHGDVRTCPVATCTGHVTTLASDAGNPSGIFVTDDAVYWTEFGGRVARVAR
jgi:hypothetical protein